MKRLAAYIVLLLALAPAALLAHIPIASVFTLPPCIDGAPFAVWVTDAAANQGCSPDSVGTSTLLCVCLDGVYSEAAFAGGRPESGQTISGTLSGDGELRLQPSGSTPQYQLGYSVSSGVVEFGLTTGDQTFQVTEDYVWYFGTGGLGFMGGEAGNFGVVSLYVGDSDDPANSAGLARSGADKLCHDTDADNSCEAGEHLVADGIESLWVGANEMYGIAGTATPGVVGTLHVYQGLPDAATTEVGGWVPLPASLRGRSFAVKLLYAESSVGSACNFRVTSEAKAIEAGTSIGSGGTAKTSSIARPSTSTSNLTAYATLDSSFATTASTVAIAVSVERLGSDGLDTCTSVLRVLGLELEIL